MARQRCDHCAAEFDGGEWHPATVGEASGVVYGFCSEACKRRFRRARGHEGQA